MRHAPVEKEWLTELDIQAMMGVGHEFMRLLKRRGVLPSPSHRIGNENRWLRDDIKPWMTALADEIAVEKLAEEERIKELERRERLRENHRKAMRKYMRKYRERNRKEETCGADQCAG